MNDMQILLMGFALGSVPTSEFGRISVAFIGKRLGVEPKDVEEYDEATDDEGSTDG